MQVMRALWKPHLCHVMKTNKLIKVGCCILLLANYLSCHCFEEPKILACVGVTEQLSTTEEEEVRLKVKQSIIQETGISNVRQKNYHIFFWKFDANK